MKTHKIEIIIAQIFLSDLLEGLAACKITGYTCLNIKQSKGVKQGEIFDDAFNDSMKKVLVFALVNLEEKVRVLAKLEELNTQFNLCYYTIDVNQ